MQLKFWIQISKFTSVAINSMPSYAKSIDTSFSHSQTQIKIQTGGKGLWVGCGKKNRLIPILFRWLIFIQGERQTKEEEVAEEEKKNK